MPFETFVHVRTPPPHTHQKKNCQIRILCQFIEKYPALKNGYFVKKNHLPPLPHSPRPHTPPPTPRLIFLLIWIICQFDFVSVIFLQIDKESNFFFFLGGGGGGGGGGGLWRGVCEHNEHMFKMALLLFKEYKCAKLF